MRILDKILTLPCGLSKRAKAWVLWPFSPRKRCRETSERGPSRSGLLASLASLKDGEKFVLAFCVVSNRRDLFLSVHDPVVEPLTMKGFLEREDGDGGPVLHCRVSELAWKTLHSEGLAETHLGVCWNDQALLQDFCQFEREMEKRQRFVAQANSRARAAIEEGAPGFQDARRRKRL